MYFQPQYCKIVGFERKVLERTGAGIWRTHYCSHLSGKSTKSFGTEGHRGVGRPVMGMDSIQALHKTQWRKILV